MRADFSVQTMLSARQPVKTCVTHPRPDTFTPRFGGKVSDELAARLNDVRAEEEKKHREIASYWLSQPFIDGVTYQKLLQLMEELQPQIEAERKAKYEQELRKYNNRGFLEKLLGNAQPPVFNPSLIIFDILQRFHSREATPVLAALKQLKSLKLITISDYERSLAREEEIKFRSFGLWSLDALDAACLIALTPLGKELANSELKPTGSAPPPGTSPFDPDANIPGD